MSVTINLKYMGTVRAITQKDTELLRVADNTSAEKLLSDLICRYPQLLIKLFPHSLKLTLNNLHIYGWEILSNDDEVVLKAVRAR